MSTPNPATRTHPDDSSRRIAHKTPLGWLPVALLLGLLLLLALIFLLVKAAGDDDGEKVPAGDSLGQAAGGAAAPAADQPGAGAVATPTDVASAGGTPSGPSGPPTGANGALSAGGTELLSVPGGRLGSLTGQAASGQAVVQSVVADEGFWVGPSATNRVFVVLTPQARGADGESPFQVTAGQTVQLKGTVKPSDAALADGLEVEAGEGKQQLIDQGGYVEATSISLQG